MNQNHYATLARAIAIALTTFADAIGNNSPLVSEVAQTATGQAPSLAPVPQNNAGVATTISQEPTGSGLLSAAETVAAGLPLTGKELDENGVPWLAEVNTKTPALTKKNIYKKGVGISADVYNAAIEAAKVAQAAVPAAPQTNASAPMPGVTGGAPMPGVSGGAPMPGQTAGAPMPGQAATDPYAEIRQQCLAEVNTLTNDLGVDYDTILEYFVEIGASETDRTFQTVPVEKYAELYKGLVGWSECLRLIASCTVDCLGLNGNDQGVIIEYIYTNGQFGCTDATLVHKSETWRLYEALANYRASLQQHFQQAVTPLAANPYL